MQIVIEDLGSLSGLDDIVSDLSGEVDENMVAEVASAMNAVEIPIRQTMGVWSGLVDLIHWVRGRRLIRELPVTTMTVPWFTIHVPHSGTAQVKTQAVQTEKGSVGIKLFGSGYSRGRDLKLEVTDETSSRAVCAYYYIDVKVLPRIYLFNATESIAVEVLGEAGSRSVSDEKCPQCIVSPDELDRFENMLDPFVDLRADKVKQRRTVKLNWTDKQSFEIKSTIPGVEFPISLNASASTDRLWQLVYEFSPGYLYQPYRSLSAPEYLPPMWAFSS